MSVNESDLLQPKRRRIDKGASPKPSRRRGGSPEQLASLHARNRKVDPETVVRLMCQGLHDKQIGRLTNVGYETVKRIRLAYMRKHGIKSHAQLGAWAVRQGLA